MLYKSKLSLLTYLTDVADSSVAEVAGALERPLPATGMALLRLVRQGLASRSWDRRHRTYFYASRHAGGLASITFPRGGRDATITTHSRI